jgi:hypothetical protein
MRVDTYLCGSCAVNGIVDLGTQASAVEAMKTFCRLQLGNKSGFTKAYMTLINVYAFCAGPEESGHGHSKPWVRYGTEFAAYIKQCGLGDVATIPAKKNLRYHPNTTAQVWIWSPNQKAMEEWWERAQGRIQPPVEELDKKQLPEVKRVVSRRRVAAPKRVAAANKRV